MLTKEKQHTTNYINTLIEVAEDTKAIKGTPPNPTAVPKTHAELQFDWISKNQYQYTSDDILFMVYALKNDIDDSTKEEARTQFFSKGQACFRASPLPKNYGFGVHADENGKIAIYGMETEAYTQLQNDPQVKKVKAMRSTKKAI